MTVMELIKSTQAVMTNNDQRSAIGMARSWMMTGRLKLAGEGLEKAYASRDKLAVDLVEAIRGAGPDDRLAALAEARAYINAPYVNPTMLGYQAARAKAGPVGSEKKNAKIAG